MASKDITVDVTTRQHDPGASDGGGQNAGQNEFTEPLHVEFTADATERRSPPTYEEAMDPAALPPPSYDSLFGRVREVHKESSGTVDFIKNVICLLAGTIGCSIVIGITIVIPVSMVIVGSMYFFECPLNYRIPIYLLVGGSLGILKQIIHLYKRVKNCVQRDEEEEEKNSVFQNGMSCFMTVWFILGSFWVYKEYEPNYDEKQFRLYCNRTVYLFAFWQITAVYIMLGIMSLCLCSVSLAVIVFARKHEPIASPS